MRLDFNVLWVEDQPKNVQPQVETIQKSMAVQGFNLSETPCRNIASIRALLAQDVFTDEVDLVLVDWDLGSGEFGEQAIDAVRGSIQFKDIIFYSARTDTDALRKKAIEGGFDGIYFSHRNDLVTEVMGVFMSLIKKALDLDHVRGIVMGATSDIDQMARDCLTLAHAACDEKGKEKIVAEMVDHLKKKLPNVTKQVDKLTKNPTLVKILGAHGTFTANDGLRILTRVLEMESFAAHQAFRKPVNDYIQNIVPRRNDLGHKVLTPDGKPGIAGENATHIITVDEMRELRRQLLDLRQSFRDLHGSLKGTGN
jgi:hypothetical protein